MTCRTFAASLLAHSPMCSIVALLSIASDITHATSHRSNLSLTGADFECWTFSDVVQRQACLLGLETENHQSCTLMPTSSVSPRNLTRSRFLLVTPSKSCVLVSAITIGAGSNCSCKSCDNRVNVFVFKLYVLKQFISMWTDDS